MENLVIYSAVSTIPNNLTLYSAVTTIPFTQGLNFSDITTKIPWGFHVVRNTFFCIFTLFVILGNAFCLIVLHKSKKIRKVTRLFMISLTCADLLHGILVALPTLLLQLFSNKWTMEFSHSMCRGAGLGSWLTNIASAFSLMSVNVDRYIAVEWPLKARSLLTFKRATCIASFIWVYASLSLLWNYLSKKEMPRNYNPEWVLCNPIGTDTTYRLVLTVSTCFVLFVAIPFLLTIFMQIRTVIIVSRHNASLEGYSRGSHQRRNSLQRDTKVLKMFIIVTFTYMLAWLPIVTLTFYELHTGDKDHYYLRVLFTMLLLCNHWWNICVYVARNRTFRLTALHVFTDCCPCILCKKCGDDGNISTPNQSDEPLPV